MNGLLVSVYPPNLSDAAVKQLVNWSDLVRQSAPTLGEWLRDTFTEETARRLKQQLTKPEYAEVTALVIPTHKWTNADLADAICTATTWTYAARSPVVGDVADKICRVIVAAAAARLRRSPDASDV